MLLSSAKKAKERFKLKFVKVETGSTTKLKTRQKYKTCLINQKLLLMIAKIKKMINLSKWRKTTMKRCRILSKKINKRVHIM